MDDSGEKTTHDNPQVLWHWKAPQRAYRHNSTSVLRFCLALGFLLSAIVWLFGDKILVMPIAATCFLFYVLTITPPPEIEHTITKFGLTAGGITYRYEGLSHFYFVRKYGYDILVLVATPFGLHTHLVVDKPETKIKIISLLSEHLVYQTNPPKSFSDKLGEWLSTLIPDETD